MDRLSNNSFSTNRNDLILQIRWLLNEMSSAEYYIQEGNIDEALKILRKETKDNFWQTIKDR
jgi:hypothetical protein